MEISMATGVCIGEKYYKYLHKFCKYDIKKCCKYQHKKVLQIPTKNVLQR